MKYFSFLNVFIFILIAIIFSIIGISLPPTINFINGFERNAFYGNVASYTISMLLFWLFVRDYNLFSNKKSVTARVCKWYWEGIKMPFERMKLRIIINQKYKSNSIKRTKK